MKIEKAQYYKGDLDKPDVHTCINADIDGVSCHVPIDPDNRHYAEIQKQVKEGTLTIKDAD